MGKWEIACIKEEAVIVFVVLYLSVLVYLTAPSHVSIRVCALMAEA